MIFIVSTYIIRKWGLKITMHLIATLKELFNTINQQEKSKNREMKRVFQWRRYLEWKYLSPQEKISAKRILFVPIFAYLILLIFNENFIEIIILISGYLLYKKLEKGNLKK